MNFRWKENARDWSRYIAGKAPLKTNFDIYYLCLMLGFATGRTSPLAEAVDLTDEFVADYKEQQRLIIGLLLRCELTRFGVDLQDKATVRGRLQQLIDPNNSTKLTSTGMNALNEYSAGGFDYLVENLQDKPKNVPEFLAAYHRILHSAVEGNANWRQAASTFPI